MTQTERDRLIEIVSNLRGHAWLERFRKADYYEYSSFAEISPTAANQIAEYVDAHLAELESLSSALREEGDDLPPVHQPPIERTIETKFHAAGEHKPMPFPEEAALSPGVAELVRRVREASETIREYGIDRLWSVIYDEQTIEAKLWQGPSLPRGIEKLEGVIRDVDSFAAGCERLAGDNARLTQERDAVIAWAHGHTKYDVRPWSTDANPQGGLTLLGLVQELVKERDSLRERCRKASDAISDHTEWGPDAAMIADEMKQP